jgi:hypothetical protein
MTRSQLVFGVLLITVGVLLLLDRAGALDAWALFEVGWPAILILTGAAQVITRPRNRLGGAVLTGLGLALFGWTLGMVSSLAVLWPLLLIALGVWLMAARWPSADRTDGFADSDTDIVAVFDDRVVHRSGRFAGGSVTAVFGDVRLDLRDAWLDPAGARLQVTTVFGDLDLVVPEGWRVTVSGPELLGDVGLRDAHHPPEDAPVLRLRVLTILGDVDIHPVPVVVAAA